MTRRGRVALPASASASASKSAAVRARPGRQTTGKAGALRLPWQLACSRRPSGAEIKMDVGAGAFMGWRLSGLAGPLVNSVRCSLIRNPLIPAQAGIEGHNRDEIFRLGTHFRGDERAVASAFANSWRRA